MPRGDRTGPNGLGFKTGRGAGYCSGSQFPGFRNFFGGGRGFGRGFQRGGGYFPPYSMDPTQLPAPEDEAELLKQQATSLEQELEKIKERLKTIEKSQKK